jgi:putative DNA primase/helicase
MTAKATGGELLCLPSDSASPLDAALAYQVHGFRPIPIFAPTDRGCTCRFGRACQAPGKHPIVRGWQRSQANERTIRARWTTWPSANVGLVTGGPGRLVVLDVDGDDGRQSLTHLEEEHGPLPETLTSATGGGGEQRLFHLPDDRHLDAIGNSVSKLGAGLDVRASGGQIVVAPSLHRSGRRYRWLNQAAPADLPDWLYGLIAEHTRPAVAWPPAVRPRPDRLRRYGEAALTRGAAIIATAKTGTRNATLFREAVSLAELVAGEVLPEDRVRRELTAAARAVGLRSFEIRMTLVSAFRRGMQRPRLPR